MPRGFECLADDLSIVRAADEPTILDVLRLPDVRASVLGSFVIMLGFGIVAPALPAYAQSFGVGYDAVGLLISAFAFNFNNFNIIYLLTGGGPSFEFGSIAGATDILISYTYKIAFGSVVQDYGLASAISVVIFVIVASISMYGIRKSKVLDDFA